MSLNHFETDEQRAEAIVSWLKSNAWLLVLCVLVVIGTIVGVHFYRDRTNSNLKVDADNYHMLMKSVADNKINEKSLEALLSNGSDLYKGLASLGENRVALSQDKIEDAIKTLKEGLASVKDPIMKDLLTVRLAQLYIQNKQYDDALVIIKDVKSEAYQGMAKDIEGDIYVQKNDIKAAKEAYTEALKTASSQFIQRKLNQLSE